MRSPWRFLIAWLALVAAVWLGLVLRGGSPARDAAAALAALGDGPWAVAALLGAYALRSLLFLPMTVLTVFAGFLLGPWLGAVVATVGGVGSAALSYGLARWVRGGDRRAGAGAASAAADATGAEGAAGARGAAAERLRALRGRPFEAVLVSRLVAVPGDVVNVVAGASRVPLGAFAAATAIGGLPGVLAGVFAGASIEGVFRWTGLEVRPSLVAASAAMLIVSLGLSALVRRRERRREAAGRHPDDPPRDDRTGGSPGGPPPGGVPGGAAGGRSGQSRSEPSAGTKGRIS